MKTFLFIFLAGYAVKCDDNYYVVQMPDRIESRGLKVYWNVPTMQCKSKRIPFNDLFKKYGIIQNTNDTHRGDKISILYDPGFFPALVKNESTGEIRYRNGGVPQQGDLMEHLKIFKHEMEKSIPDENFNGVGIIDFESWRPVLRQNFGALTPYKDVSYDIEKKRHWWWKKQWIQEEAKRRFEAAGRDFMQTTLALARKMRPKAVWGYYGYPQCFNRPHNSNPEKCAKEMPGENDEVDWLWAESTALYPSVYSSKDMSATQLAAFIKGRVKEAHRVKYKGTPVLPYWWFRYRDGDYFTEPPKTPNSRPIADRGPDPDPCSLADSSQGLALHNTRCPPLAVVDWLWAESTALYPSVYSSKDMSATQLAAFIKGRVKEAHRVKYKGTPVLPYWWFRYRDGDYFTESDLEVSFSTFYKSNASGVIIWGSSKDVNTVDKCLKLRTYVENVLGPVIAKYTKSIVRIEEIPVEIDHTTAIPETVTKLDPEYHWEPPENYSQNIEHIVDEELKKENKTIFEKEKKVNESALIDLVLHRIADYCSENCLTKNISKDLTTDAPAILTTKDPFKETSVKPVTTVSTTTTTEDNYIIYDYTETVTVTLKDINYDDDIVIEDTSTTPKINPSIRTDDISTESDKFIINSEVTEEKFIESTTSSTNSITDNIIRKNNNIFDSISIYLSSNDTNRTYSSPSDTVIIGEKLSDIEKSNYTKNTGWVVISNWINQFRNDLNGINNDNDTITNIINNTSTAASDTNTTTDNMSTPFITSTEKSYTSTTLYTANGEIYNTNDDMDNTQFEMDDAYSEMDNINSEMGSTNGGVNNTHFEMESTSSAMDKTRFEMDHTSSEMDNSSSEMDNRTSVMDETTDPASTEQVLIPVV